MKKKILLYNLFLAVCCVTFVIYFYESIVFSKEIIYNVSQTFYKIVNIIFPSLFGFMVACDLLIRSNLFQIFVRILNPLAKYIFKIPSQIFLTFVLSCIGGYPVGLRLVHSLVNEGEITKSEGEKMLRFCYCTSPAFAVGIVGNGIFHNKTAGLIVYISCVISNFVICIISRKSFSEKKATGFKKINLNGEVLVDSITESGKSMFKISIVIIFFSYITTLLDCMKFYEILKIDESPNFLKSLLEVTNIVNLAPNYKFLPLISFLISTGGVSILIQIIALNHQKLSLKSFLTCRIPIGILASGVTIAILKFFPINLTCNNSCLIHKSSCEYSPLSSICILFMIITLFFNKKASILKKNVL